MGIVQPHIASENVFAGITSGEDLASASVQARSDIAAAWDRFSGVELMGAYSDLADGLVSRIFELALGEAEEETPDVRQRAQRGIAIAAVGGYGRREMSPFSDVDIAFIVGEEDDEATDLVVKRAFRALMDVMEGTGLSVGYSYRRADEVLHLPLETQTALLDARLITGSAAVLETFYTALIGAVVPAAFVIEHARARRKPNGTPYVVEPELKEGHGGLRDLHAARWIARVAFGFSNDDVWQGLRSRGILLDSEVAEIGDALEFHCRARNALHLIAGRALDTLSVERHGDIGKRLGFPSAGDFMSAYYTHAGRVWRIFRKVVDSCIREHLEIEPGIIARDGRICLLDRGLLTRDPAALVRIFEHGRSYDLALDRATGDMVSEVARDYTLTPEAAGWFVEILSRPGAAGTLRAMADADVLQAVAPQFGELMCLIPGDAAHQYTVGEHSLRTVEELEALLSEEDEEFADVFSRVQHFEVLFLAALLHDCGKLESVKDHAKAGAFQAATLALQLGMADDACAKVEFLVRQHLVMAEAARLRDVRRPKTVSDFVALVDDPQLLDMLFLLTVADGRAVGTANWNRVQVRFLLELHERAYRAIRSPGSAPPDLERHKMRMRRELSLANLPEDEVEEHVASMPASYLLNTPPEELAAHIGYTRTVRSGLPAVDLKDERAGEFTRLTVVAEDRPGLLSDIAGVLFALGIDVHAAQTFTRHSPTDDIAINILYIDFEGRQLTETMKSMLEGELRAVLAGRKTVADLLSRCLKRELRAPGEIAVKVLGNLSDSETVIEVRAHDVPGLLYYLTRRISDLGLNIHTARVATWGHEARDAFYVTNADRKKLEADEVAKLGNALNSD